MKNLKQKILIATSTFNNYSNEDLIEKLKVNNFEVDVNDQGRKYTSNEMLSIIDKYDGVIAGTEPYNERILNRAKKLKIISRLGIGTDNIDLKIASKKRINVFITQTTPAQAVAELSLGLMLDLSRQISNQNYNLKNNNWLKQMGSLLSGKTLGIIGLGTIGKTLIRLSRGFNFKFFAYDIKKDKKFSKAHGLVYVTLEKLLSESDIVSIHLDLNEHTKNLLNSNNLNLLKPSSIIINTSRGGIVNEKYLFKLLKNNLIAGAGLDVFEIEPYIGNLKSLNNVILTPHIGSYALELRAKMEEESVSNLIEALNE